MERSRWGSVIHHRREAYFVPDFEQVSALRPDLLLFFSEPEYPIHVPTLLEQRGWTDLLDVPVVESTVDRGNNVIHDGPSCVQTSVWLTEQVREALGR